MAEVSTYPGFFARAHLTYDQLGLRGTTDDVDDRRTPRHIFDPLMDEFAFTLDAAAAPDNALCERYFDLDRDGLAESWAGERVWCNPPYTAVGAWVRKAWLAADADLTVMLVPANRTEQGWWQDMIEPYRDNGGDLRTRFVRGRIDFERPDGVKSPGGPPFGCVLLIWQRTKGTGSS